MSGVEVMAREIAAFIEFTAARPELTFLVTEIGCGIAGYTPGEVAPHFRGAGRNVALPASFIGIIDASRDHS